MTLSKYSMPLIYLHFAGIALEEFILELTVLNKVSITSVDLPPPDTPVTQVNVPNGKETLMFFKLFPDASIISRNNPLPFLTLGISTFFSPDKYLPVIDFGDLLISFELPSATTKPPLTPTQDQYLQYGPPPSASKSCSTTIIVLP